MPLKTVEVVEGVTAWKIVVDGGPDDGTLVAAAVYFPDGTLQVFPQDQFSKMTGESVTLARPRPSAAQMFALEIAEKMRPLTSPLGAAK